ncbi:MAG: oligosaccharide flippase family protein [Thermoproteota archaeon]|nr:oligosaccharide flippase family protein [Thermoproteota archaeon]
MEVYDTKYLQETLRSSSLMLIYIIASNLSGIIYFVVATRILSMFEVGALLFASVIINFFPILFGLALSQAAAKFCAENLRGEHKRETIEISNLIFTLGLILFFLSLVIGYYFVFVITLPLLPSSILFYFVLLVAIDGSLNLLLFLFYGLLIGNLKFFPAVLSLSLASSSRFIMAAFVIYFGGKILDVLKFWIIGDLLGIISFIIFSKGIISLKFKVNFIHTKRILSFALPLYLSLILNYIFLYIDRYQVVYSVKLENFSIYGAAMTASMVFVNIPLLLSNALVPYFSYAYVNRKEEFNFLLISISRLVCLTFLPLLVLISMLAEPIIYLFAGSNYVEGWFTFFIVTLIVAISFPIIGIYAFFLATGKTKVVMYSSLVSVTIGFVLIYLLTFEYGTFGASIGRGLMFAANFIFLAVWLYYKEKVDYGVSYHFKISLITFFLFLPILIFNTIIRAYFYYGSIVVFLSLLAYLYFLRRYSLLVQEDLRRLSLILPDNINKRLNNFFNFLLLKKNKNKN